ncbi:hypothetical protein [Bacillus sp. FSL E2-0195]
MMARKRNSSLRSRRELNKRKKPNDGTYWAKQLLQKIESIATQMK